MFLKTGILKKSMKAALKGRGLTVGNVRGCYLVYSGGWGVYIENIYASNKFKAAVMELIGDIPGDGECYRYSLSPEKEILQDHIAEVPDPFEEWKQAKDYAVMTPLSLHSWQHDYIVYQKKSDLGFLMADRALTREMISPSELDASMESMPGRPNILHDGILYYKNETMIYWVCTEACGDRTREVLFPSLGGIDFFQDDWIKKEEEIPFS